MAGAFSSAFSSAFDVGGASVGSLWWYKLGLGDWEVFKNVASQKVTVLVIDTAANTPKTGDAANLTAYVSKDDGAVTALTDTSASELDATNAPGLYSFDLTQAETNADKLLFSAKSSTSGIRVVPLLVYTRANNVNDLVIDASGNLTAGITGNITGNLSGSVGSVTGAVGSVAGAVGSVTGNVGGNVTGTVGGFTSSAKAEIQTEAEDALVAHRLDELLNADSDIDGAAPPTVGSVFHELLSKTAGSFTFDQTTDSLEAIRDRGDAAWVTATGFSTHSAADVWAAGTRTLTAGTNINGSTFTSIPWNASWDAEVQSEAEDALAAVGVTTTVTGRIDAAVSTRSSQTSVDTVDDFLDTEVAAIKAKTDLIPASPAAVGSAMTLTSGERDSVAAALLDLASGVETSVTVRQALRLMAAALGGVLSGAATTTVTIKAAANSGTTRVTATVDADGNRSALTLNL